MYLWIVLVRGTSSHFGLLQAPTLLGDQLLLGGEKKLVSSLSRTKVKLAKGPQPGHHLGQDWSQQLAPRSVHHRPHLRSATIASSP